jgi:hypothetical protein
MTEDYCLVLSDLNEDIRDELELLKEIFFKEIQLFNRCINVISKKLLYRLVISRDRVQT